MEDQEAITKPLAKLTPDRIERLWWMLKIMAASGNTADASDSRYNWINAFCLDYDDEDTFNLANRIGFIRVSHDGDMDYSAARLTPSGSSFVAWFTETPVSAFLSQLEKAQHRIARLEKVLAPFGKARINVKWHGSMSIGAFESLKSLKIKHLVQARRALHSRETSKKEP